MRLSISETARIFNISVRALHYYDEIGLLKPSEVNEVGYRFYEDAALETLQQIVFYRELEIPLKTIASILQNPDYDKRQALQNHRQLLLLKKQRLEELLMLVDETMGEKAMNQKPKITAAEIQSAKQKYAAETMERWGQTDAYKECLEKHASYTEDKETAVAEDASEIFQAFANAADEGPESETAQKLVRRWQDHITKYHYRCTKEILSGLGVMYVEDERFTQNIDRYGDGTAQFMSDAIRIYCSGSES